MAARRLNDEERALWARVAATVAPMRGRRSGALQDAEAGKSPSMPATPPRIAPISIKAAAPARLAAKAKLPGETLDGGWDRRLARGAVPPDRTIDLHGHTLASAHMALDHALDCAIGDDCRLLLVVTGKARPADASPRRGLIRAHIGDWLAGSPHAGRIAAIRNAHPRHGGGGALYLVLRRRRSAV